MEKDDMTESLADTPATTAPEASSQQPVDNPEPGLRPDQEVRDNMTTVLAELMGQVETGTVRLMAIATVSHDGKRTQSLVSGQGSVELLISEVAWTQHRLLDILGKQRRQG
jgi:hypothetical protein